MSYVRVGEDSDVYVYSSTDYRIHCCGCPYVASRTTSFSTADPTEMIEHLEGHLEFGHKVPARAFVRLRADAVTYELRKGGWVRKESKWQLPKSLGLVRYEPTDWVCDRAHREKQAAREPWVPVWCHRISQLPCGIEERRAILYDVAHNDKKRAALEAAFESTFEVSDAIILAIAEANVA